MSRWLADWWWAVLEVPVVWMALGWLEGAVDRWHD